VGAEKLLGKGDMLFYPAGSGKPIRVQGAYINEKEIETIVEFLKKQSGGHQYDDGMIDEITSNKKAEIVSDDADEYFMEAVEFVIEKEKASASMLQRQFGIGYNRAASIIEEMEARGYISQADGAKPRKILVKRGEY
jgi:S-DNA-T family DNA segregation ATPase FtsK/SpoIIIE